MIEVLVQCECGGEVRGLFARYSDIDKPAGWEDWGGRQTCPDCLPKRDADPEREAQHAAIVEEIADALNIRNGGPR